MVVQRGQAKIAWYEGVMLVAAAPFLLFPEIMPVATAVSLVLIIIIWVFPWLSSQPLLVPTPLNLAMLCFLLMLGVSILVTADPELTLPKATSLILGLTSWRYLVNHIHTRFHLLLTLCLLGGLGVGFTGMGVLAADWMFKVPIIQEIAAQLPEQIVRVPGVDGVHTNQLAGTVLPFFPLLLALCLGWSGNRWQQGLLASLFLVTTAVLILTQSRTGYIGAVGGGMVLLLLWAWLLPATPRNRKIQLGISILLAVGLIGGLSVGNERLLSVWQEPQQETVVGSITSLSFRQEVWQWSVVAISDFPFTGTGLGTFRQVVRRFYPLAITPTYDIAHAHNIFLQTALDVGLPGLVAYLSLVGLALQQSWQVAVASRAALLRPVALGLIAGMVAIHLFGVADALALGAKPALIFWVMLAMMTVLPRFVATANAP